MDDISRVLVDASDLLSADQNPHPHAVLRELLRRATAGDLSDPAFRVLVALFAYADETGFCFPSQQTIANLVGICERSVRNGVVELETRGLLTREVPSYAQRAERRGASTRYQLAVRPRVALRKKAPARAAGASTRHDPEAPAAPASEHRHAVPVKVPIPEGEEEKKRARTHTREADPVPVVEACAVVPAIEAPQTSVSVAALSAEVRPLTPEEELKLPLCERKALNRARHAAKRAEEEAERKKQARTVPRKARQGASSTRQGGWQGAPSSDGQALAERAAWAKNALSSEEQKASAARLGVWRAHRYDDDWSPARQLAGTTPRPSA